MTHTRAAVCLALAVGSGGFLSSSVAAESDAVAFPATPIRLAVMPSVSPAAATTGHAATSQVMLREMVMSQTLQELAAFLRATGAFRPLPSSSRWLTNDRAIQRVRLGAEPDAWDLDIHLERRTTDGPLKSGEAYLPLPYPVDATRRAWRLSGEIRVPRELIGSGVEEYLTPMRARWVLQDRHGRRVFGPNTGCSLMADAWMPIAPLTPTYDAPIPKGLIEEGFDLTAVTAIGVNIESGNIPTGPDVRQSPRMEYEGTIQLRNVRLEPLPLPRADEPPPAPLYATPAEEAAAAPAIERRLRERLGLPPGQMAVMVNMAWPYRSGRYHVYGTALGLAPWGDHWGFSSPPTATAVREDLRFLKAHGIRVVRMFLFGDLRAGLEYDERGVPVGFARKVDEDMRALLAIFQEEDMLLIPSLVDFLVADNVTREGPGLPWTVGERPELFTDPERRAALVRLLDEFVQRFDGPQVLMWEVMNEPDNAVAVCTPAHYNGLRRFVYELAARIHRRGLLTTVGSRHLGDHQRFWRGAVDVPQLHHWRLLESVVNPYAIDTPARELGPLPSMVGEIEPVPAENVAPLLDRLKSAGYLMVGFWSLRGHDGFAFAPIAPSVQAWLADQAAGRR